MKRWLFFLNRKRWCLDTIENLHTNRLNKKKCICIVTGSFRCCFTSWTPPWPVVPLLEFCLFLLGSFSPLGPAGGARLRYRPRSYGCLEGNRCGAAKGVWASKYGVRPLYTASMPAAAAGQVAPGTVTMRDCGWTRHTASSFHCGNQRLDESNAVAPKMEIPGTTGLQRGCYNVSQPWLRELRGLGFQNGHSSSLPLVTCSVGSGDRGHVLRECLSVSPPRSGKALQRLPIMWGSGPALAEGGRTIVLELWLGESQDLGPPKGCPSSLLQSGSLSPPTARQAGQEHVTAPLAPDCSSARTRKVLQLLLLPLFSRSWVLVLHPERMRLCRKLEGEQGREELYCVTEQRSAKRTPKVCGYHPQAGSSHECLSRPESSGFYGLRMQEVHADQSMGGPRKRTT